MQPLEILSKIMLQTLKEFSTAKRAVTVQNLCESLSENEEITSLIRSPEPKGFSENNKSGALYPSDSQTPNVANNETSGSSADYPQTSQLTSMLSIILAMLGLISKEEYIEQSSEFQRRLRSCKSVEAILACKDDFISVVDLLTKNAYEKVDYAQKFLSGLHKNLEEFEKKIYLFRCHNQESLALNGDFYNELHTHTNDINLALDKILEGAPAFISTKLQAISKAIETKQQQDEIRLEEADSKISELQESVRVCNEEIIQAKDRTNASKKEVLLDDLMQIHNRRAYELRIREEFRRYRREGQPFSQVNDLCGHRAGDKCLRGIAKLIRSTLSQTDFLARYGGEELVAILESTDLQRAQLVAEKIRSRIEKARFSHHDAEIPLTISIGVAESVPTDRKSDNPLERANNAMSQAKKNGKNRVCTQML